MDAGTALVVAAGGYLVGSVSFARIVARLVAPATDVARTETELDGRVYVTDAVSSTVVREKVGMRWGILTGLLDMAKAALPTLLVGRLLPGAPYDLIVAGAVMVGHDFPLYHRFHGGRGESIIVGSLLVLDPLGLVLMILLGSLLGFAAGSILLLRVAGFYLLVPWLWLVRGDPAAALFLLFALCVFYVSLRSEFGYYAAVGARATNEETAGLEFGSGRGLGRAMDRWSIPALVRRARG